MIWWKLVQFTLWVKWLFKLPKPDDIAKADPSERCPCCGYRGSTLRCVLKNQPGAEIKNIAPEKKTAIFLQFTCKVCGCRWFRAPVVKGDNKILYPAVARNELEKTEDSQQRRNEMETAPTT